MAAKFKVGDRVKCTENEDGEGKGKTAVIIKMCSPEWAHVRFEDPIDGWGEDGQEWGISTSKLVPVAATTGTDKPLRIEAGKFYKTRDGRKVGPATKDGKHLWSLGEAFLYDDNGKYGPISNAGWTTSNDLIAEWPTEQPNRYSSCEAAQVDVQREEYGPIEPAHPTTRKFTWLEEQVRSGRMSINDARRHVGIDGAPAIVALIENGQPKPAPRPHVHADRDAAATEASRLARQHPGKEFGVYELVTKRIADVVVREAA